MLQILQQSRPGFLSPYFLWRCPLLPAPIQNPPTFRIFNRTFTHLSERFLKVAGTRFLLPAVMFKMGFLIGETHMGDLQLMVFPLKARAVGMLRHVRFPQPPVDRHQARSLFCKHRVLVIQPLQFSNQRSEPLSSRGDWSD